MRINLFPLAFLYSANRSYIYSICKQDTLLQIIGKYSFFDYNKGNDIFRYGSKYRRQFKKENPHKNCIEDHHIIPKQFRNHPLIVSTQFDIGSSNNLLIMYRCSCSVSLNHGSHIHQHGHIEYNKYVKKQLDYIYSKHDTSDERKYNLYLLVYDLKRKIRDKTIPWNIS